MKSSSEISVKEGCKLEIKRTSLSTPNLSSENVIKNLS